MTKEERPIGEGSQEPSSIITNRPTNADAKSSAPGLIVVGIVLVVSLLVAGLFLPPISLGQRLAGEEEAAPAEPDQAAEGGQVTSTDTFTAGALTVRVVDPGAQVAITPVTAAELSDDPETVALSEAVPAASELEGDVYLLDYEGGQPEIHVDVTLPGADSSVPALDLYGWDGAQWRFIPLESVEGTELRSVAVPGPEAVAVVRAGEPENAAVAAEVLPTQTLPAAVLPYLTEVTLGTLTLTEEGTPEGTVAEMPDGAYRQLVRATNTGVIVDQAGLAALLHSSEQVAEHQDALVAAAASHAGLNLDYQGVPRARQAAFTEFAAGLADALHAEGKVLAVTLATPAQVEDGQWDSGGQDWQALGQLADAVYVQMPLNPAAYEDGGAAEQMVEWAVRQINRHKLNLLISANAVDVIGGNYREVPNMLALGHFGELTLTEGGPEVEPGAAVEVGLSGTASALEWDGSSMMYKYSYEQAGQEHTVWLNNEAAVSNRLRIADDYNVGGVALRGLGELADEGAGYAAAIESYLNDAAVPEPAGAAIVWTVEDAEDAVVSSNSGEALSYRWEGTEEPGEYTVNAVFAQGDALADLGAVKVAVVAPVVEATPEPEEEPVVAAVDEEPEAAEREPAGSEEPIESAPPLSPGEVDAVTNVESSFRSGPSIAYARLDVLSAGTGVALIGRTTGSDWLEVQLAENPAREGWIFAELLNVNAGVEVSALEVTGTALAVSSGSDTGGGDDSSGSPAPAPAAVAPVAATGNFALGGQAFGAPYGQMSYAGMTWIKRQHKWSPGNTGQEVAGMISEAHNGGMRILLSIPGQSHPGSIDYNAYVNFLRNVASLPDPPDAIEIWNEMNIDREWPSGQISPQTYVQNMLAPAYNAIKGANSNVMVVSGAPAPTGFFGGCGGGGCDDAAYVSGMAAAGAASYTDCVGVHYNEGILPPAAESGDPRTHHYTRYFWGMLNTYYNAFGGSRPLCFTELGYLTPEGYGGLPGGFAWAQNTSVAEQAQWLAQATSLAASSGKVRMLIVWNVDSTTWNSDPQAGYAIIRPDGSCPACEALHQVMGQ